MLWNEKKIYLRNLFCRIVKQNIATKENESQNTK